MPAEVESIIVDAFDRDMLRGMTTEIPTLAGLQADAELVVMDGASLIQDVTALFWKAEPQLRDAADMTVPNRLNRAAVEAVLNHPETEALREHTQFDRYSTALATAAVAERMLEVLQRHADEQQRLQEEAAEAEQGGQRDAARNAQEAVDRLNEQVGQEMSRALASVITEQLNERQEEEAQVAAWGVDPGELQRRSFEERLELSKRLSRSRMARFRDLIGRFRMMARSEQARKVEFGRDELYAITLGNDLTEVLPSELVGLSNRTLRREFFRKYAEGQLLSRKWRGKERAGDGPIIVLLDTSTSMDGDREGWAKAFTLALMEVAKTDRRAFTTILFSSAMQQHVVEGADLAAMIEVGEVFLKGGTNFDVPLEMALGRVRAADRKADIVFITDGEGDLDPATSNRLAEERESGLRVFGISIAQQPPPVLATICDNVRRIDDFLDPTSVSDIFTVL